MSAAAGRSNPGTVTERDAIRIWLQTDLGPIGLDIFPSRAPNSVTAFLRRVDAGQFEQLKFWRSVRDAASESNVPIQVVQAGFGEAGSIAGDIEHETTIVTGMRHLDGVVSLARDAVGSASAADFFICVGDQPELDFGGRRNPDGQGFAAFGRVVEGMDIVRRVHQAPTFADAADPAFNGQILVEPVSIVSVVRDVFRSPSSGSDFPFESMDRSPSHEQNISTPVPTRPAQVRASRAAWFALWVLVAATLFAYVDQQVLALVADPMAHDLGLQDSQLGVIQGLCFAIFGLLATYPLGWLSDRLDRRLVLSGCIAVWAAGTAACGMADGYMSLLIAALAIGAGQAGLVPICYAVIPDMFEGRERETANQIFYVATILGAAAGMFLGGVAVGTLDSLRNLMPVSLASLAPWRLIFIVVAMPAPLLIVLVGFARLGGGGRHRPVAEILRAADENSSNLGHYLQTHWRAVLMVFAALCAYGLPFGGIFAFAPIALSRLFDTPSSDSGIGLGLGLAVGCLFGVLLAAGLMRLFAERLGPAAALRISGIALFVFLPSVVLLPFASTAMQVYWLVGLEMTAGTLIGSLLPNIVQNLAPGALRGRVTAVYSIASGVTAGLATYVVGPISDQMRGWPRGLLIAIAVVSVVSWIVGGILMRASEKPFVRTLRALGEQPAAL